MLLYTEREWGQQQQRVYKRQFDEAFTELRQFPGLGMPRPELGQDIRSRHAGQHVVIYEPSDTELRIVRVLHARRDLGAELES